LFVERDDQSLAFAPDAAQAVRGPTRETPKIAGAKVGQFMLLPVSPEILHGVEFGRIGREAAGDHSACQRFKVLADGFGTVDARAVPDDQQLPGQMALEMSEELNDLRALDAAGKEPEVEVRPGQSGDGPEVLPVEAVQEQRCLPLGDQVRTRCGFWVRPLSSMKTIVGPSARGLFF